MKLGIMQPYFAPALGYFDLIAITDDWIIFDTAQYRPKSWMNRNRILHPHSGWQYITAHTGKVSRGTPIRDVALADDPTWRAGLLRKVEHYRGRAPHYRTAYGLLRDSLWSESQSLARLCVELIQRVCDLLSIPFRYRYFSQMDLALGPIDSPGDWALRISEALGATHYINPPGGEALFDREAFAAAGVELVIRQFPEIRYQPAGYDFVPALSIIDVLMWCSPAEIAAHLAAHPLASDLLRGGRK